MDYLPFRKIKSHAIMPTRFHNGDAGLDFYACLDKDITINPGERAVIDTGIGVGIPYGMVGVLKGRSGLAKDFGIDILGGVIDYGYAGEVSAVVLYTPKGDLPLIVKNGDKICQMVIYKIELLNPAEVSELPSSDRGESGFGASGSNVRQMDS